MGHWRRAEQESTRLGCDQPAQNAPLPRLALFADVQGDRTRHGDPRHVQVAELPAEQQLLQFRHRRGGQSSRQSGVDRRPQHLDGKRAERYPSAACLQWDGLLASDGGLALAARILRRRGHAPRPPAWSDQQRRQAARLQRTLRFLDRRRRYQGQGQPAGQFRQDDHRLWTQAQQPVELGKRTGRLRGAAQRHRDHQEHRPLHPARHLLSRVPELARPGHQRG